MVVDYKRPDFVYTYTMTIIKSLYTVFLAVLVSLFIGLGVSAFYPSPKAPEYPTELSFSETKPSSTPAETDAARQKRQEYDAIQKAYQADFSAYNRMVSIVTLVAAIVLLAIGLVFVKKIDFISDGLLLGGVFTLFYSIGRGFASDTALFRFIITTAGLAIVLFLGYYNFIRPKAKS